MTTKHDAWTFFGLTLRETNTQDYKGYFVVFQNERLGNFECGLFIR